MKRDAPLSLRLTPALKQRLEKVAKQTGLSQHAIAQLAVEAGIVAIEENDGIVVPITFVPKKIPAANPRAKYPAGAKEEVISGPNDDHVAALAAEAVTNPFNSVYGAPQSSGSPPQTPDAKPSAPSADGANDSGVPPGKNQSNNPLYRKSRRKNKSAPPSASS